MGEIDDLNFRLTDFSCNQQDRCVQDFDNDTKNQNDPNALY